MLYSDLQIYRLLQISSWYIFDEEQMFSWEFNSNDVIMGLISICQIVNSISTY